jgi:uncharacterized protein with WD repeat
MRLPRIFGRRNQQPNYTLTWTVRRREITATAARKDVAIEAAYANAANADDNIVRVWDTTTGQLVYTANLQHRYQPNWDYMPSN